MGWRLSPAFDMNPTMKRDAHVLAIDDSDPHPDLDTAMKTAEFYRVKSAAAKAELAKLQGVLSGWREKARGLGLSAEDRLELQDCIQA